MASITNSDLRSCTIQDKAGRFCNTESAPGLKLPVCADHAISIYRDMAALIDSAQGDPLFMLHLGIGSLDQRRRERNRNAASRIDGALESGEPTVYYVLVGEKVKIGYTANLTQRLRAYPPDAELLATEPGDKELERTRHQQFREYLTHGREWFAPGPALREHVESLRG